MSQQRFITVSKNASNPAYRGARKGVERLAKQLGVEVHHFSPKVDDSIEEQIAFVQGLLADLPTALLISPAHESALDTALEQLRDAGIPIVMFVGQTTRKELAHCFIGSDKRGVTRAVAETVGHALGGQGSVMVLDGNPLGILYEARARGCRNGIAQFDGLRMLGAQDGLFLREPAHKAMHALMDAHGTPDAVLVANDFMALGAMEPLRERGARALVGSLNATPEGIDAILRGGVIPRQIMLPAEMAISANLAQWSLPYEQRPLPDWDRTFEVQGAAA